LEVGAGELVAGWPNKRVSALLLVLGSLHFRDGQQQL
jgi:hypothetical protein